MSSGATSDKKSAIASAIDFFIHARLHDNPDLLTRARFLVLMLLSGWAVYVLIFVLIFIPSLAISVHVALPINVGNFFTVFYLLYRLRQHGSYSFCGFVAVVQGWANIILVTAITGGPFASSSVQLLSITCVMAFFLGGNYWGVVLALLSLVTVGFMALLQIMGVQYPLIASPDTFPFVQSFLLPINLLMMTTMAVVYEVTYESVKRQRDIEHQKFLALAATDPLTGLANRRMFDETLAARIALYGKLSPVRRFALCYLDLDKFKPINDRFGHGVGDEVLSTIATRLRLALRGADFIGRHGGDEFLLLLDRVHDAAGAEALSKRFLQLIREPISTSAGPMQVDGSFGFALFPDHGADAATLQQAADHAMYEAKRQRCGYRLFTATTD